METELKLELAREDVGRLARAAALTAAGAPAARLLVATYHDTVDDDLRRAGLSLRVRVRVEDGRHVQTVKADGAAAGLFARPEWESVLDGADPVVGAASGPAAQVLGERAIVPRFETDVIRKSWLVDRDDARIEVALDEGEVRAGAAAEPIAELELELVHGPVAALFGLARLLDDEVPLRLGFASKAERGHRLAAGRPEAAIKAEPIVLDPAADAGQAFATIAHACLRQFRANEVILLARTPTAAPLHQARVGLRRLRSAFSLFKPLLADDPRAPVLAGELRALAGVLGAVRDLDVLIDRFEGAARGRIAEARETAVGHLLERLEAPATRRLMLDLAEWLAIGAWREAAREPVVPFAAHLLGRRRKRLKRDGRNLSRLDDHRRHQVRIDGKKLRYAAEFFAGLWTGKKARRRHKAFLSAIEVLQEQLGQLNDVAAGATVLERLGLAEQMPMVELDVPHILAQAEDAYEVLMDVKPFWR